VNREGGRTVSRDTRVVVTRKAGWQAKRAGSMTTKPERAGTRWSMHVCNQWMRVLLDKFQACTGGAQLTGSVNDVHW